MNPRTLTIALLTLLLCLPAVGQEQKKQDESMQGKNTFSRFYNVMPKEGHARQLEEGLKKHMAFHRQHGDNSPWYVWTVETGPQFGSYLVGTMGHQWSDFDKMEEMGEADAADVEANIVPHVQHATSSIWMYRGDISPAPEGKPSKFTQVVHYALNPKGVQDFENVIKQINKAMMELPAAERGNPPMIYQLYSGGKGPRIAIVFDRDSWGAFAPSGTPVMKALKKALGEQTANDIMNSGLKAVRYSETEILRLRPDLASPPAGGMSQ